MLQFHLCLYFPLLISQSPLLEVSLNYVAERIIGFYWDVACVIVDDGLHLLVLQPEFSLPLDQFDVLLLLLDEFQFEFILLYCHLTDSFYQQIHSAPCICIFSRQRGLKRSGALHLGFQTPDFCYRLRIIENNTSCDVVFNPF